MSSYLCRSRIILTGWNGADGDVESWETNSQGGQEVQEEERARIGRRVGWVGCRAAQRTVLACHVEELKPLRKLTSGGIEQKVTKLTKGRAGSKAEEDRAGKVGVVPTTAGRSRQGSDY